MKFQVGETVTLEGFQYRILTATIGNRYNVADEYYEAVAADGMKTMITVMSSGRIQAVRRY